MGNKPESPENCTRFRDGRVIQERWRVVKKLGEGSFGAVYRVTNVETRGDYAMKVEPANEEDSMIAMEVAVLKTFRNSKIPHPHVCDYVDSGATSAFRYVVMRLVGPNLADVRKNCPRGRFSESSAIRLGIQCVRSIEALHRIGFIHRDVKPPNYAVGLGPNHRLVYLLDFGLARQYVNSQGKLRAPRTGVGFRGTVRYASINAHTGNDLGRHDDLWSLLYMLVEVQKGALPWRKIKDKKEVGIMKRNTVADRLLEGLATEFHAILNELQGLQFQDTPNYEWFVEQFNSIMRRRGYRLDEPFDWEAGGVGFEAINKAALAQQPFKKQKKAERKAITRGKDEEKSHLSPPI